ncbi:hypothetical protein PSA01_01050 [Pseudonocardia saturnea]|uniref:Uncharacterized protein n=1 Tax=Pseudonocardia saturnea TaxID=33909 RepID=A0ABQ0RQW9_9PSEU|nr:hypothetical protein Pdca_31200 [Pseudonocardia autotrophica]GEC23076.1 hypothetical protein PSA01_01050 [Pseudonocardia saturnea]
MNPTTNQPNAHIEHQMIQKTRRSDTGLFPPFGEGSATTRDHLGPARRDVTPGGARAAPFRTDQNAPASRALATLARCSS